MLPLQDLSRCTLGERGKIHLHGQVEHCRRQDSLAGETSEGRGETVRSASAPMSHSECSCSGRSKRRRSGSCSTSRTLTSSRGTPPIISSSGDGSTSITYTTLRRRAPSMSRGTSALRHGSKSKYRTSSLTKTAEWLSWMKAHRLPPKSDSEYSRAYSPSRPTSPVTIPCLSTPPQAPTESTPPHSSPTSPPSLSLQPVILVVLPLPIPSTTLSQPLLSPVPVAPALRHPRSGSHHTRPSSHKARSRLRSQHCHRPRSHRPTCSRRRRHYSSIGSFIDSHA